MMGSDSIEPADLPKVGERAKLRRIVERFPHFWIAAGATGTVTEATEDLIALRMDKHVPGAEAWDNELCWSADDAAFYTGSVAQRIAAAFYADVEIIDGTAEQMAAGDKTSNDRRQPHSPTRSGLSRLKRILPSNTQVF